ncbi:MAG: tRNA (adenosine(37)-N6)-dimethylallyltransferase MiaA [Luteimonas sp.]
MMQDRRPLAIALMGPTASGKTALALEWAERYNGEIVSVDSALVYRGLDIGAAKPDASERARAPHHMIDLRDPWQRYSAAQFATDARAVVSDIVARDRLPILAGGTGLYFRALLRGLSPMPEADAVTREAIATEAAALGWPAMHAQLARIDAVAAARIRSTDPQRIQRALEVFRLSGKPISEWQRGVATHRLPCRVLKVIVAPCQRHMLHARIEQRFDRMLNNEFLDEVQALRALPAMQAEIAPLDLPAVRAVGYRQAWEYLDDYPSMASAAKRAAFRDRAVFATRQLAKRQLTWLRGEHDARWFDPDRERNRLDTALALFFSGDGHPAMAVASKPRAVV